jgi:hypothetical protein
MEVSARAWPGPPGPTTPTGASLRPTCDNSRTGYGLRPSSLRVAVSTPCTTASTDLTCCGRRVYLHAFDRAWAEHGVGEVVRYADDFVVLCESRQQAEEAQRRATAMLGDLGLELHPDKTRVVDLREGRQGFDFLGCHLRART